MASVSSKRQHSATSGPRRCGPMILTCSASWASCGCSAASWRRLYFVTSRRLPCRPDSVTAHNNLGLILLSMGQAGEAKRCFQQAVSMRPDLAASRNNLGLALLNEGQLEQARPHFEEAIRLQPDLADAHNNLGLALDATGKPDDALTCFERAVALTPDHFGALCNLGNSYKDQGLAADAIAFYRRALALRPDDAVAHSNLLLAMQYQSTAHPDELLVEARRYALRHADHLAASVDAAFDRAFERPPAADRVRFGGLSRTPCLQLPGADPRGTRPPVSSRSSAIPMYRDLTR